MTVSTLVNQFLLESVERFGSLFAPFDLTRHETCCKTDAAVGLLLPAGGVEAKAGEPAETVRSAAKGTGDV